MLHPRCAGLDLSKRDAKVCIRSVPTGRARAVEEVSTWSSMTGDILALRDRLIASQVTCVVMEATGDYVRHEGAWVKWEAPWRFG